MENVAVLIEQSQKGDREVRTHLIEQNLGLVRHIVKRYQGRGCDPEDLFQIGVIGLIKAVDHFDLEREVQFSTYAVPMIMGEIKRFFRDDGIVKVSRGIKENAYRIRQSMEQYASQHGREASVQELQELTGLDREDIVLALEAGYEVESIYQAAYKNDDSEVLLIDKLPGEKDEHERLTNHIVLQELMGRMEERDRQLINLRYFENKTQTEVAGMLGISQVQVSRQEKKILLRMRAAIGEQ
ncbi:MAG: SigB/SigF/SigG family RNA polymerase sigma factor [Lachnospiraceae bacterium]|nr:SigB/SigF/SigG family RNA polymerase sigma factor [Lachnospiraceae bacterium]